MTQPVYVPLLDSTLGVVYPLLVGGLALVKGLIVGVSGWSWLTSAEYTAVLVQPDGVELRYLTWPRPSRKLPFDQIESVSVSVSGRRTSVPHLMITSKPGGLLDRKYWESAPGSAENIAAAIQWIEHASGGRVARPTRAAPAR